MFNRQKFLCISFALAASAVVPVAGAQTAGTPTRSGSLAPAGEGPGAEASTPNTRSTQSRSAVKAQTRDAEKAGTLAPAGDLPAPVGSVTRNVDQNRAAGSTTSIKSRSDVKAQTKTDRSSGSLQPAGEAAQPSNEAPKK